MIDSNSKNFDLKQLLKSYFEEKEILLETRD